MAGLRSVSDVDLAQAYECDQHESQQAKRCEDRPKLVCELRLSSATTAA
jgi:hypothetical protein